MGLKSPRTAFFISLWIFHIKRFFLYSKQVHESTAPGYKSSDQGCWYLLRFDKVFLRAKYAILDSKKQTNSERTKGEQRKTQPHRNEGTEKTNQR